MAQRSEMITELAFAHGPCSVRQIYYRAVVAGVPGIAKTKSGYRKVQDQVLKLRRAGDIPYRLITDSTRWMKREPSWSSVEDFLAGVIPQYRRSLWDHCAYRVEIWCESDSIASTIVDIGMQWDLATMCVRGYSSETFAYNAAEAWRQTPDRIPMVLYIGDHDPDGLHIERKLRSSLAEFWGGDIRWDRVGVTWSQVEDLDLPGGPPKKRKGFTYDFPIAVEAEALPPQLLRSQLEYLIESLVDDHELDVLRNVEQAEREGLELLAAGGLR